MGHFFNCRQLQTLSTGRNYYTIWIWATRIVIEHLFFLIIQPSLDWTLSLPLLNTFYCAYWFYFFCYLQHFFSCEHKFALQCNSLALCTCLASIKKFSVVSIPCTSWSFRGEPFHKFESFAHRNTWPEKASLLILVMRIQMHN